MNKKYLFNIDTSWSSLKGTKERFLKQGFDQKLVDETLEKVEKLVIRVDLLQEKDQEPKIQNTFH